MHCSQCSQPRPTICTAQEQVNPLVDHGDGVLGGDKGFRKWKADSITFRNKWNVLPQFAPWTSRPEFKAKGIRLTPRTKDLIDCCAIQFMKTNNVAAKDLPNAMKTMFLDLSQSLNRRAYTINGVNRCLTTSTCMYSFGRDRLVTPLETLYFQGFPKSLKMPLGVSQSDMKDMAGEGMTLPCLASVMWGVWNSIYLCQPPNA